MLLREAGEPSSLEMFKRQLSTGQSELQLTMLRSGELNKLSRITFQDLPLCEIVAH